MLQVRNVSLIHKKDLRTLVSDFSFTLNPGDKAVIIGEEGNGKSTLLKSGGGLCGSTGRTDSWW